MAMSVWQSAHQKDVFPKSSIAINLFNCAMTTGSGARTYEEARELCIGAVVMQSVRGYGPGPARPWPSRTRRRSTVSGGGGEARRLNQYSAVHESMRHAAVAISLHRTRPVRLCRSINTDTHGCPASVAGV